MASDDLHAFIVEELVNYGFIATVDKVARKLQKEGEK
jgi:hypothetical protein